MEIAFKSFDLNISQSSESQVKFKRFNEKICTRRKKSGVHTNSI